MLSRAIYKKQRGRRWLAALAVLSLVTGTFVISSTSLALTQSEFELDKDATNDVVSAHLGTLKSSVNGTTDTAIIVCTFTTGVYPPAPGASFTILVDGEQMTVTSYGTATTKTGGCGFGDPALIASGTQVYNVTRGVNGTTKAAHSGGSDVTQLISGVVAGDDWNQVYAEVASDPNTKCTDIGAVECAYIADPKATDNTYFTGGGSKDDLDINDQGDPAIPDGPWLNTDSSVPPSDEILDGFAAKYDDGTRQLLFFGADRWTTNGAKDFGFWFFKNPVAANTVTHTFSGTHTVGDILILGTFTQGGAVATVRVFSWVGTGGDVNNVLQTEGNFGDCVPGGGTGNGCNTVNNTTILAPWPYQGGNTGNVAGSIYAGGMLEGGIDLTALGLTGCFSSFMAETRSSPSIGAQLKDFVLGTFEACGSTITTDASDDTFVLGGSISDTATLNITGGGPAPTGFIDFYVCGPEDGISSCDATGTAAGHIDLSTAVVSGTDYTVTSDTVTPLSAGDYCFYAEYPAGQDTNYPDGAFLTDFTDECFTVEFFQPSQTTAQTWSVFDTMTIDVAGGGDLLGTAHFTLHRTTDCSDAAIFSEDVPVSGPSGTSVSTTATSNSTFTGDEPTLYWNVSYESDNPAQGDIAASCTENTNLDINN